MPAAAVRLVRVVVATKIYVEVRIRIGRKEYSGSPYLNKRLHPEE